MSGEEEPHSGFVSRFQVHANLEQIQGMLVQRSRQRGQPQSMNSGGRLLLCVQDPAVDELMSSRPAGQSGIGRREGPF